LSCWTAKGWVRQKNECNRMVPMPSFLCRAPSHWNKDRFGNEFIGASCLTKVKMVTVAKKCFKV
jgi:hypothetical protein